MKIYIKSAVPAWRNIYDLADDLRYLAKHLTNDDSISTTREMAIKSAADAIVWYMNTGRSYRTFDLAMKKANLEKLMQFMVKDSRESNNYDELIQSAKKYLMRYCGLPRE